MFNLYQAMKFPEDVDACHRIDSIDVDVGEVYKEN